MGIHSIELKLKVSQEYVTLLEKIGGIVQFNSIIQYCSIEKIVVDSSEDVLLMQPEERIVEMEDEEISSFDYDDTVEIMPNVNSYKITKSAKNYFIICSCSDLKFYVESPAQFGDCELREIKQSDNVNQEIKNIDNWKEIHIECSKQISLDMISIHSITIDGIEYLSSINNLEKVEIIINE